MICPNCQQDMPEPEPESVPEKRCDSTCPMWAGEVTGAYGYCQSDEGRMVCMRGERCERIRRKESVA